MSKGKVTNDDISVEVPLDMLRDFLKQLITFTVKHDVFKKLELFLVGSYNFLQINNAMLQLLL